MAKVSINLARQLSNDFSSQRGPFEQGQDGFPITNARNDGDGKDFPNHAILMKKKGLGEPCLLYLHTDFSPWAQNDNRGKLSPGFHVFIECLNGEIIFFQYRGT